MRKLIAIMLFGIFLVPLVIVLRDHRNKEYTCLTPEEIEALKRYQAITDIVCPTGEWVDDYSWVQ